MRPCAACEGEGRVDDPGRCLRCGMIGCHLIDCAVCGGTGLVASAAPTPNPDEVICPGCAHRFRAIPERIQLALIDAGYAPPFLELVARQHARREPPYIPQPSNDDGSPFQLRGSPSLASAAPRMAALLQRLAMSTGSDDPRLELVRETRALLRELGL